MPFSTSLRSAAPLVARDVLFPSSDSEIRNPQFLKASCHGSKNSLSSAILCSSTCGSTISPSETTSTQASSYRSIKPVRAIATEAPPAVPSAFHSC